MSSFAFFRHYIVNGVLFFFLVSLFTVDGLAYAEGTSGPVRVTIQNRSNSSLSNTPLTFGQVFSVGEIGKGESIDARIVETGQALTIQSDAKATHNDESLRHTVLSTVLPSINANEKLTVELSAGSGTGTTSAINLADLLATGYDAVVRITLGGTVYTSSARSLLEKGPGKVWLSGSQATEWLVHDDKGVRDSSGNAHPHVMARFAIRAYANGGSIINVLTDVSVENNWTYESGPTNRSYDVSITINGSQVYSKNSLPHYHHSRWHKKFWTAGEPPVHIGYDPHQLMATGAVSNYDPNLVYNTDPSQLQTYVGRTIEPMEIGLAERYMPDTGAHIDIGLLPRWAAMWLLSQDYWAKKTTVDQGGAGGSWSIHYRDKGTDLPVSLDDYPYLCSADKCNYGDTVNPSTGKSEAAVTCSGCSNPSVHDKAHQPSFAYLPYLITGEYYLLEELQFWANYNMLDGTPAYRGYEKGTFSGQVRGQAWSMRELARAAYITPDSHPLKAYFVNKVENNISRYTYKYVTTYRNSYGALNSYDYPILAPWMDDFFTSALGVVHESGFSSVKPILEWKAQFPVQRMGFGSANPDDFCWTKAATYQLVYDGSGGVFSTIKELFDYNNGRKFTAEAVCGSSGYIGGYADQPTGYPSNLQPALAIAKDAGIPGASEAWARFEGRSVKPDYSGYPNFAVVPRNTPITGGGGSTPNNPPIARAGSDISIIDSDDNGSETVTLNGDASSDSDGTIVSYRWKNGATELGSGSEISPSIAVGTHTVTLTVEDDRGWTDSDTVQVIVTSPSGSSGSGEEINISPVAEAGYSQTTIDFDDNRVELITLDGSGSQDYDGNITDYSWTDEAGTVLSTEISLSISLGLGTHIITLTVSDNLGASGRDTVAITINEYSADVCTSLSTAGGGGAAAAVATAVNTHLAADWSALDNLAAGQWYEIKGSQLSKVLPSPLPSGNSGSRSIMSGWSGGAYDMVNDRLMVFGGGHADYSGNEVYAFDVNTLAWNRLSNPSSPSNAYRYQDGTPTSRHTYDSLKYVPSLNSMCSFGVGSRWEDGSPGSKSDCFNVGTGRWYQIPSVPGNSGPGQKTAYDPNTGLIYHHGGSAKNTGISVFDPSVKRWIETYDGRDFIATNSTAAFDPKRNKMIVIGSGVSFVWDFAAGSYVAEPFSTSGANDIVNAAAPGLVYDPTIDRFVAWHGGGKVYTLNMDTRKWSQVSLTNSVRPGAAQSAGTYGRFQYIVSKNLYVAVNATDKNVFFFRLKAGSGSGGGSGGGTEICSPGNSPPTANSGRDILVTDTDATGFESVYLNASNSSDSDGSIISYSWTENGNLISTEKSEQVLLDVGEHYLVLTVVDEDGASSSDTLTVTVKAAGSGSGNAIPVAVISVGDTAQVGNTVVASGAKSSDANGSGLGYSWQLQVPSGSASLLTNKDDVTVSFIPDIAGNYQLNLVVNDGTDPSKVAKATIRVTDETVGEGLTALWKLDEPSGSVATDSIGSHHGNLMNGAKWIPDAGYYGGALNFDGLDDYVDLKNMDAPNGIGLSISLWYNADTFENNPDARFISKAKGVHESAHNWMLSTYEATSLRFRLKTNGHTSALVSPPGNVSTGKWQHIAATYDGQYMRLYRFGVQIASLAKTGSVDHDSTTGVALGGQPAGTGQRNFDGSLDDVRIYNRALTVTEIRAIVNGRPRVGENRPPAANAGSDRSILDRDRSGAEDVLLDGRGSVDPGGTLVRHEWILPDGEVVVGETITARLASGKKHTIELVVTDNDGATDRDTVIIDVKSRKVHSLVSPSPGSTLKKDKITFSWDDYGDQKESWVLQVGTTRGGKQVYTRSLGGDVASHTVYGLPANGKTLYLRLFSRETSTSPWEYTDDTYNTKKLKKPEIYSPARGSRLRTAATFRWRAKGRSVRLWRVYVGSRRGSRNIFRRTLRGYKKNVRVTRIPANGRGVWVRLCWKTSSTSAWKCRDYYYKGPRRRRRRR